MKLALTLFGCLFLFVSRLSNGAQIQAQCSANTDFNAWLNNSPPNTDYKLVMSQGFIRHGDRTPYRDYYCWNLPLQYWNCSQSLALKPDNYYEVLPKPYNFYLKRLDYTEYFEGNCMVGQLTNIGYNQHFSNGKGLNERYINYYNLLPKTFDQTALDINDYVVLRSDNEDRTQQSAMTLFEGLYYNNPTTDNDYFNIVLETQDSYTDIISPNANICPLYNTYYNEAENTKEYKDYHDSVTSPLEDVLEPMMYDKDRNIFWSYDCATCYSCHNLIVPANFTTDLYNQCVADMVWNENYKFTYPSRTEMGRVSMGPLFKLWNDRFVNKVNNNNGPSFYLYSGHDSSLAPFKIALGSNLTEWIGYASLITMELFERISDNELFIMTSYNGKQLDLPSPCDSSKNEYGLCSWNAFSDFIAELIPTDQECPGMNGHNSTGYRKKGHSYYPNLKTRNIDEF